MAGPSNLIMLLSPSVNFKINTAIYNVIQIHYF